MRVVCLIILLLLLTKQVFSDTNVLINEFSVEPNQSVELINTSQEIVDISNWYIDDNGGTTFYTIPQNSLLLPHTCLTFAGDFNLNKTTSDIVRLFNSTAPPTSSSAQLVDLFSYKSSPGNDLSNFRNPDGESTWTTGPSSFGKYNATNESCIVVPSPTPTLPIPSITTSPSQDYNTIYISEVMTTPIDESEWVELFNNSDTSVSLTNWYIDDIENGGSSPKLFSLTLEPHSFNSIDLTNSLFNDSGDTVRLLDSHKDEVDSYEYTETQKGKTFSRITWNSNQFCISEKSKNTLNNPCILDPTPTEKALPTPTTPPLTPTQKIPLSVTHTPTPQHIHNSYLLSESSPEGAVLGTTTEKKPQKSETNILLQSLGLLSLLFSLLTIITILIRMKPELFSYAKNKIFP